MTSELKWRLFVGAAFIFLAGVATGLFVGAWHMHHRGVFPGVPRLGERMRSHFQRELKLTPDQMATVSPILDRTVAKLEEIRTETNRRVAQTMAASHAEAAPYLNPEQRARLDEMEKRHRRALHSMHPPPPGGFE